MSESTQLANLISELEIAPITDDEAPKHEKNAIPFASLAALGGSMLSLSDTFRTVTTTTTQVLPEGLYSINWRGYEGSLMALKDGAGFTSTIQKTAGGLGQVGLNPVSVVQTTTTATVTPIDPVTLGIAIAIAGLEKKLDEIQETQKQILGFIIDVEKSKLKGNLNVLNGLVQRYKYNIDNQTFCSTTLNTIASIEREANQAIELWSKKAQERLNSSAPIEVGVDVHDRATSAKDALAQYQLALYEVAFCTLLEVLVNKNFEQAYLNQRSKELEEKSLEYRKLFTECSEKLEQSMGSTVEQGVLGAGAAVTGFLGDMLASIPVIQDSPVDEMLKDASKDINKFKDGLVKDEISRFASKKDSCVAPFVESIHMIQSTFNKPLELYMDNENMYYQLAG